MRGKQMIQEAKEDAARGQAAQQETLDERELQEMRFD